jgi:hypothetical protein
MEGVERAYLNAAILAVLKANQNLGLLQCQKALQKVPYGKSDTLELDATPENTIKEVLTEFFDRNLVLITEEEGKSVNLLDTDKGVVFVDPMDGSKILADFLINNVPDKFMRLKEIFANEKYLETWAQKHEGPVSITGCCCSVTAVKTGSILFNVMVNYLTQEIFIACQTGIYHQTISKILPEGEDWESAFFDKRMRSEWPEIKFPKPAIHDEEKFVTYLKKEAYIRNLEHANLIGPADDRQRSLDVPGPARILYLSTLNSSPVGFILANGEKIGEWLGWLAYARFAETGHEPILQVYEVSFENPGTIEKVLMAPGPHYSVFESIAKSGKEEVTKISLARLRSFENSSHYRATILVAHRNNTLITGMAKGQNARRLVLSY